MLSDQRGVEVGEKYTEFHSRESFTLTMDANPEQIEFFNEWSREIPTLYHLDICVASMTKLSEENISKDERKQSWINELRKLDRKHNSFSYLFALMEKVSDPRGKLSDLELKEQILGDVSALRCFFKKASVYEPDEFLVSYFDRLKGMPVELNKPSYIEFIELVNNKFKLKDTVSLSKRLNKAKELLNEASTLGIYKQHPVVLVALACLYGNIYAKKLMKFKADANSFDAENALADILLIPRAAALKLEIEHYGEMKRGRFSRSIFLTDDGALDKIRKCFEPQMVKNKDSAEGRETAITFTVRLDELLTEVKEDEYVQIVELLS